MKLKEIGKWKKTFFVGLGIMLLGFFLRVVLLDSLPVFADEAIYIRWAQVMKSESTLRFLPMSDGKQPLFMWSVIPFLKFIVNPLIAGRMVSVLTGMGTLVGIFLVTLRLFKNKKTALVASLMYAISPFSVFFDRIGLVDSMLSMFGVWTMYFGILTSQTLRLDFAMITGFFLGGALLTKSPAMFFSLLLPTTWILVKWPKKRSEKSVKLIKLIFIFIPTYLIGYGMFNILRLGPNFHMLNARNLDYVFPISHLWENPMDPFLPHIDRALEWFWQLGPSVLIVFFVTSLVIGLKNKSKEILVLFAWLMFPILVQSMYAKVFTTRYVFFTLPAGIILSSYIFGKVKGKSSKKVLKVVLGVFVFHALWINYLMIRSTEKAPLPSIMRSGYLEEWTSGTGIKESADYIRGEYEKEPDKKIVVGTEGYFGTLPDGLQMYLNDLPEITVIGVGLGLNFLPSQLVESRDFGNKTYLVVNKSRILATPESMELKLVGEYKKAERSEKNTRTYIQKGPQEVLYLFEVK